MLDDLLSLPRMGSGIGLHRVLELAAEVFDDPWLTGLDAVKVTGSNGKGSVAAMTAAILTAAGVETGLYTSPHLFDFRERITVGGRPVDRAELEIALAAFAAARRRFEADHPGEAIGAFEAITAVALRCFARARPATVVAEAGLGGRFDPTRLIPGRLTALVSLDLEHTSLLGSTLEAIAYDKADLAADGGELVVGDLPPEIRRRLAAYARARRLAILPAAEVCAVRRTRIGPTGMRLDLELDGRRWADVSSALVGEHQATNAAVAVTLASRWLAHHRHLAADALERAVRAGLAAVRWPCRLERVATKPDVWVDAGHTPAAIDALVASARRLFAERPPVLVVGVSHDKDGAAIVARLAPLAERVVATRARHKGRAAAEVAALVRQARPEVATRIAATVAEALAMAIEEAAQVGTAVLVAGGLFLAAEAAVVARGGDPTALRFL